MLQSHFIFRTSRWDVGGGGGVHEGHVWPAAYRWFWNITTPVRKIDYRELRDRSPRSSNLWSSALHVPPEHDDMWCSETNMPCSYLLIKVVVPTMGHEKCYSFSVFDRYSLHIVVNVEERDVCARGYNCNGGREPDNKHHWRFITLLFNYPSNLWIISRWVPLH